MSKVRKTLLPLIAAGIAVSTFAIVAAEAGDAKAMLNLAGDYAKGSCVAKDPEQAVAWFRKAAEQGEAGATFNLGACYLEGTGVKKDKGEALKWFEKAAALGHATHEPLMLRVKAERRTARATREGNRSIRCRMEGICLV